MKLLLVQMRNWQQFKYPNVVIDDENHNDKRSISRNLYNHEATS